MAPEHLNANSNPKNNEDERRMPALISEMAKTAIEEGIEAASNDDGRLWTRILLAVVVLVMSGAAALKWFYPYTINDLKREIKSINKVIEENTTLEWDFLGDSEWEFRERLDAYVHHFPDHGG
ncbi:hypothetical protein V5O48_015026 [Marasmius crinis-equi]|uniref:Uncharacterized protein n=1 Tax=Marasmius crinis-equi TaxID=585013 RepID=A0ABR3EVQ5_9AGAR